MGSTNYSKELPDKDVTTFDKVLKHYQRKEYKQGLKLVDKILKKYPDNGESLAMKGIMISSLDKKTDAQKKEAHDNIKSGIRNNISSYLCWYVFGLFHRSERNYEEAAKCYTTALKNLKEGTPGLQSRLNTLGDLALLQTQLRRYRDLVVTRNELFKLRGGEYGDWLGLAVANHLAGQHDSAIKVIKTFLETFKFAVLTFEESEVRMYHNSLIEEKGDFKAALEHLKEIESRVKDKLAWKEKHALFLAKTGETGLAEAAYRQLIDENPDDSRYIQQLLDLGSTGSGMKADALLSDLLIQYPRSKAVEDMLLTHTTGDTFKERAEITIKNALRKGVPSLFASMKRHYHNPEKQAIISGLFASYSTSLSAHGTFGGPDDRNKEPPTAYLWTLYYLAQHYDYLGQREKALQSIDEVIQHTPTVVELYMTKGRILKHMGKIQEAATVMNEGRELDLQDRFINSKCAKYQLRAGHIAEAEATVGLFTRAKVDAVQDLRDMQCQWFMVEQGHAYLNAGERGKALKRFHDVEKFYVEIYDDQFDFHGYCVRNKKTFRSYISALRFEDTLRSHPYYLKAAKGAVQCYLSIADDPPKEGEGAQQTETGTESDEADPHGALLLHTKDPLGDAIAFVRPLEQFSPQLVDTHTLGFEIYLRQKNWPAALKCLSKAAELDPSHSSLQPNTERLKAAARTDNDVQSDLDEQLLRISQLRLDAS